MRIAIDARWIFPEISGIGAYTRDLIRHLALLDNKNRYLLLFDNEEVRERTMAETGTEAAAHVESVHVPYGVFSIRNQCQLPGLLRRLDARIYHSTNYMIPLRAFPRERRGRVLCVTTIHDLIPMIFRDHAPRSRKARLYPVYRWLMEEVGRRADCITTDSESSRRDIIKHLRIPEHRTDQVKVIHCGVSTRFQPRERPLEDDPARVRQLLYVGRCDPYKNIGTLLKAFALARERSAFDCRLVIAGSPDARYPEPQQLAESLGIRDAVQWTGYVSDAMLIRLYQDSDLLVHPSRYEGFGLQVAEAMAAGIPVVCSNGGSLPEVAGDATILLDPDDVEGFAKGITEILNSPARAAELMHRGLEQVKHFTWERTAEQMLRTYTESARHA